MTTSSPALNLALVAGTCSGPPDVRVLPSGSRVANLAVTVAGHGEQPATSVPVAVWDPPGWVHTLDAGDPVVVLGRVRRRFWRAGGATTSRVEVEAEIVRRGSDRRARAKLVGAARARIEALEAGEG
jgi:single-strand DNA-binding protein